MTMYAKDFKNIADSYNPSVSENKEKAKKFFEEVLLKKIAFRAEHGFHDVHLTPGYAGNPNKSELEVMRELSKYIEKFGFESRLAYGLLVVDGKDSGEKWSDFYISWKNC